MSEWPAWPRVRLLVEHPSGERVCIAEGVAPPADAQWHRICREWNEAQARERARGSLRCCRPGYTPRIEL